jgi:hypothetical protein
MTVRGIPLPPLRPWRTPRPQWRRQHSTVVISHGRSERSILKSWYLALVIFAVPARALAVWPPSTSLETTSSEASSTGTQGQSLPSAAPRDRQAVISKLEQDEHRLGKVIQDLKDDEAALKKLSDKHPDDRGGTH